MMLCVESARMQTGAVLWFVFLCVGGDGWSIAAQYSQARLQSDRRFEGSTPPARRAALAAVDQWESDLDDRAREAAGILRQFLGAGE